MTHRTLTDLTHDELAVVVREYLLGGHLVDRSGMPNVMARGTDAMREVAIDEWMGASPIYSKRMQRLLGYEGDTVETVLKGLQLEIGSPLEYMDFRMHVIDDRHGEFHVQHCGALMDIEPMGEELVVTMCHHIEDPTFDATASATHPKLRMRPLHRPPRVPADRQPHCAWSVFIDDDADDLPFPTVAEPVAGSRLAALPLATIEPTPGEAGRVDYREPLDPDLRLRDFAPSALRAIADEVCVQAHLLVLSFAGAVERRWGTEDAVELTVKQFTGVAGVVAERLRDALALGTDAGAVATVFALHPAFRPGTYVDWQVAVEGDAVHLALGDCTARHERGHTSWITTLADGFDRPLGAIAAGVDPHWHVEPDGRDRWTVTRRDEPVAPYEEVALTKISTGAGFRFRR